MSRSMLSTAVIAAVLLAGCAATKQADSVKTNGFLAPYRSLLKPGTHGRQALLAYTNPQADWASYDKILLKPVLLWNSPHSNLSAEQRQDMQRLVDGFYAELYNALSKDYRMVQTPGSGVMEIQVAVSHGEPSQAALLLASKFFLPAKLASSAMSFTTGKPAFTGQVTVEAVVKDARTGNVLGVGADRRVGGVKLFNKNAFNSWGDVKNSLRFYARAAVWRLCVLRGGTGCVKPHA